MQRDADTDLHNRERIRRGPLASALCGFVFPKEPSLRSGGWLDTNSTLPVQIREGPLAKSPELPHVRDQTRPKLTGTSSRSI